jgi:hypothetical protein
VAKDPILDRVILQLTERDVLRFRDLTEGGCLTLGGLGAGKTTTVGRMAAMSFLQGPYGGLILTVKSDETERWIQYVRTAGREKDLFVFGPGSPLSFDPLAYMSATGQSAGLTESIAELLNTLLAVGKVYQPSSGERYFEDAVAELVRAAVVLLVNAEEPLAITSIYAVLSSLPREPAEIESPEWQNSSECARIIGKLRQRKDNFTPARWSDLDVAIGHLLEKFPTLDPRTRSNVESTLSGLCSKFLYEPFRSLFCSGRCDFTPEQTTHEHKLILVSMPVLEFGRDTARLCQVLMKLVFARGWLRHQYQPGCCHGAFLYIDEAAFLMSRMDSYFHMVCRSSAIAPFLLMQNILSIAADEFGEQTPGSKTLGFLGLIATKVFLANNETLTNEYASNQIGREFRFIDGWSAGESDNRSHTGVSGSKQLTHLIEPIEFTRLLKPDGENPLSEGVVYQSGRAFNATKTRNRPQGLPFLRVHFSR